MSSSLLRSVLGGPEGGPSISFQDGEFVFYSWGEYDSPMQPLVILKDPTWYGLLRKLHDYKTNKDTELCRD